MSAILQEAACVKAEYRDGAIHATYSDGVVVAFPAAGNRRLRGASADRLNHIEIGHFGLHWPELDEDLSHAGLRAGCFGQP